MADLEWRIQVDECPAEASGRQDARPSIEDADLMPTEWLRKICLSLTKGSVLNIDTIDCS